MTNFKVYQKTLSFSLVSFLWDLLGFLVVVGCGTAGFFLLNRTTEMAILGLILGVVVGGIGAFLISLFITNRYKCAPIAMMTKGVTEGNLEDNTFRAGLDEMKGKFGKITAFFFITRAIKGIFKQIGRGVNQLGTAVGGSTGNAVTSTIDTAIQILIGYLCDCCLGWIFFRKDINSFKAGCEGAVIFFKHGKTLIRNVGRIFGMGLLSLVVIAGAVTGILFAIFSALPAMFQTLANEIAEIGVRNSIDFPEFLMNPTILSLVIAAIIGIVFWSMIHSVFIRPFILVGVLRNFMAAGQKNMPTEADFKTLDEKCPKFSKLYEKAS